MPPETVGERRVNKQRLDTTCPK